MTTNSTHSTHPTYPNSQQLEAMPYTLIGHTRRKSMKVRDCHACGGKIEKGMFYDRACFKRDEKESAGTAEDDVNGPKVWVFIRHNSWCHEIPVKVEGEGSANASDS